MNTIVTTNQKPVIDTKKPETKEHRYTTKKIIKPQRKKLKKKTKTKNFKNSGISSNKMAVGHTYH